MNVASLELCKELYELSGWKATSNTFRYGNEKLDWIQSDDGKDWYLPAYDLGYLLRQLPESTTLRRNKAKAIKASNWHGEWAIGVYGDQYREVGGKHGDTPEDAAAKLAIELFKQGILTRVGDVS